MANTADSFAALMQIPGLQELLNSQITQARQQEPLRTAATQTALGQLPNSSFGGSSARPDISAIPRANFATAAPQGGNALATALKYLAAGGAGALAGNALSGGNALGALIDGLKKLAGRGGSKGVDPYGRMGEFPYNGYDFWGGLANDPSGGTGRGPGLDGVDTSGLDFGGLNIPEIPSGMPNGLPGSWPALADPSEE